MQTEICWSTDSFEKFRRGQFGAGGQNIFVSARGVLQRIHQYDLTRNGYFDLLFANCQDHHESAESYIYALDGTRLATLPGQGALSGMVTDLNDDGHPEVIITGYYDMAAPFASTDIYWGDLGNYSENNHTRLPTPFAEDCCTGRFDGQTISVAFAMPNYEVVRIFKRTELGFEWTQFHDFPIQADLICACDLDGDGYDELITRKKDRTETIIYWGSEQGLNPDVRTVLPELPKEDILQPEEEKTLQSDMEKKFSTPRLLQPVRWGGRNAFTRSTGKAIAFISADSQRHLETILTLEVPMAVAVAIGDLDGDGYDDIAIAAQIRNNANPQRQTSFIIWNGKEGIDSKPRTYLDTLHACSVDICEQRLLIGQASAGNTYTNHALLFTYPDFRTPQQYESEDSRRAAFIRHPHGAPDILVVNHYSRSSVGYNKSFLYLGGPNGYTPESCLHLPSWCAVDSLYADLDDDGWAELLIANNSENSLHLDPGHHIHHFGPQGFMPEKSQTIRTDLGWGVVAGDFNHDGFLEIITPCNHWQDLRIFYGKDNFRRHDDISLQGKGSPRWICAVDINRNGWLDLVVPLITSTRTIILWGGPQGFSIERSQELAVFRGVTATAADLSKNGYPDIIVGGHVVTPQQGELPAHHPHHSFVYIYWNGPEGISESKKCILRADASSSLAVADFNNDGWLDIFTGSYHGGVDRDIDSFIYWNRNGQFRELDRKRIFTHSASGCIAADFNDDGWIDLAVANHKIDGDHKGFSSIWWNGPQGFTHLNRTDLPTCGPHGMTSIQVGNQLDRGPEEYYISEPRRIDQDCFVSKTQIDADVPPGTWIKLHLRKATAADDLAYQPWQPVQDFQADNGDFIQYKLSLGAKLSLRTPRITAVRIWLHSRNKTANANS